MSIGVFGVLLEYGRFFQTGINSVHKPLMNTRLLAVCGVSLNRPNYCKKKLK